MIASARRTTSNRFTRLLAVTLTAISCHLAAPALAADDAMTPIAIPAQPKAIKLGTGPLPGATARNPGIANTAVSSRATSPKRR